LTPPEALVPPGKVPAAVAEEFSMFTPVLMSIELLLLTQRLDAVGFWWCMNATLIAAAWATAAAAFW